MDPPSVRRLALADLTEEMLRALARSGEPPLIERKREPPEPAKLAAEVNSFANTLGGWLLIGVDDDGGVVGYDPGRSDLQSHLANLLRAASDPLPPFVAETRELDEKPIGVVRVFESADLPHIVRETGGVHVRTSGGKEPIRDHRTLLELARRGKEAEADARARLTRQPLIWQALVAPDTPTSQLARGTDQLHLQVAVRAAPLTVTPQFTDWPISNAGADWALSAITALAEQLHGGTAYRSSAEPYGRGVVARSRLSTDPSPPPEASGSATIAADSAGVIAAKLRAPKMPLVHLGAIRESLLQPLLDTVVNGLDLSEAHGRSMLDVWLWASGDVVIDGASRRFHKGGAAAVERSLHAAGELRVPAHPDDEVMALARSWEREFAREVGIPSWEGSGG